MLLHAAKMPNDTKTNAMCLLETPVLNVDQTRIYNAPADVWAKYGRPRSATSQISITLAAAKLFQGEQAKG